LYSELTLVRKKNQAAFESNYYLDEENYYIKNFEYVNNNKFKYKNDYTFDSFDAFSDNIYTWRKFFKKYQLVHKDINYLEIGSFEGRSSVFVLEELVNSQGIFVDPFQTYDEMEESANVTDMEKIYSNFKHNLSYFKNRSTHIRKVSSDFFLENNSYFDLIYIDGSHFGEDVYLDAVNAFNSLNDGGFIIFDDLFWIWFEEIIDNPLGGIAKFLIEQSNNIKLIYTSNQLIIKKI
jgi:hypothetical protein